MTFIHLAVTKVRIRVLGGGDYSGIAVVVRVGMGVCVVVWG